MERRRVLVLNTGSSSLKWTVLDAATGAVEAQDGESWHGETGVGHGAAIEVALKRVPAVDAVGHRVVHGGSVFREAVVVDDAVRKAIAGLAELAPLHNPAALAGIDAVSRARPGVPQVAAFDTAFHHTIPDAAALYPLPRDWTDRYKLRRYGFHGLSVSYAVRRGSELLGAMPRKLVVCHLGAGCSVTAVADGRSVDTSMGFTPLEGMMMATRSGSIDPGLMLYLLIRQGMEAQALDTALNQRSGVLGVSGISADFRTVQEQATTGSAAARFAYDMFVHSLVRTIGAMIGVLGGLDALVFTGGIGEHSATVRADVTTALAFLGVAVDAGANEGRSDDTDIAARGARVRVPVITAREDLTILADVRRLLG
jgi:acetate kinase